MFVKSPTGSPALALALARAAHDEAARQMLRAAEFHLKQAAKLDRQLNEDADAQPPAKDSHEA